jgi:hypothetical protein
MSKQKPTLIDKIEAFFKKYVILPAEEQYLISSLFVMHSWAFEYARATPILYVHSPEPGAGKTRFLEVFELLVRNPERAMNVTPAALFTLIEEFRPTLMVDEVDAIFNGKKNEDLRAVINAGYRRGSNVVRMRGGDIIRYHIFCPKILAGIYNLHLPDTIRDRSLPVTMRKRIDGEELHPFYAEDAAKEAWALVDEIEYWLQANQKKLEKIARSRLAPIEEIGDRQWEISTPLIEIANVLGIEAKARDAVRFLFKTVENHKAQDANIFKEIKDCFNGEDKLFTAEILEYLGEPWTSRLLAKKLRIAGIEARDIRKGNLVKRGYTKQDFNVALGEL